jgi:hypothetical protein
VEFQIGSGPENTTPAMAPFGAPVWARTPLDVLSEEVLSDAFGNLVIPELFQKSDLEFI